MHVSMLECMHLDADCTKTRSCTCSENGRWAGEVERCGCFGGLVYVSSYKKEIFNIEIMLRSFQDSYFEAGLGLGIDISGSAGTAGVSQVGVLAVWSRRVVILGFT